VTDRAAPTQSSPSFTKKQYLEALKAFDAAVCEAIAVSQAAAGIFAPAHKGYATKIFTRVCGYSTALIRAVPRSRWVHSDSEFWDFGSVAGYCRAIFEGQLLLWYVIKQPVSDDEWSARLNVMHLNDCSRRIEILGGVLSAVNVAGLKQQQSEIRDRLKSNSHFLQLESKLQRRLLSGELLTIAPRDELLVKVGWKRDDFYLYWHLLSQYTHVLPLSFYRLEANGRGTGVENEVDRGYICLLLEMVTQAVKHCTDQIVKAFPDAESVRKGLNSRFSPGPTRNRPKKVTRH
jgi:hypothetical protein